MHLVWCCYSSDLTFDLRCHRGFLTAAFPTRECSCREYVCRVRCRIRSDSPATLLPFPFASTSSCHVTSARILIPACSFLPSTQLNAPYVWHYCIVIGLHLCHCDG